MRRIADLLLFLAIMTAPGVSLAENQEVVYPAKMSKADIRGEIFARPDMKQEDHGKGNTTLSVTTLKSSDEKFFTGMYRSGGEREEYKDKPYGVDEFMYFLEGSVTLTSADGAVQVVNAGEAVTIPKEWKGIWESNGYTKIWVIYSNAD
ncbi:MAG: DUF861 domain-containing protein [Deltaproteobacteria bacterium]|nr:DUF861 domain-containing protein [Deltaproteobacteria bacterium]